MHKELYADIPSDRMKQMIAAFAIAVSVSCHSNNPHFVVRKFHSGRNRKASSMKTIESITFQIVREFRRLTDAGYDGKLMRFDSEVHYSFLKCLEDTEVSAARAPGRSSAFIIVQGGHLSLLLKLQG
jgi:hypothetical protein